MFGISVTLKIRKWVSLPGPVELGMADCDALGDSYFTPFQEGPTWQDWEERVRRDYPVRYFLSEVLGKWVSHQITSLEWRWDWLVCHVVPKHRYHMVDLRGVDPLGYYAWGYLPPGHMMELAAWKALRMHVEDRRFVNPALQGFSDEVREEPWFIESQRVYSEASILYWYWMVDRGEEMKLSGKLSDEMHKAGKNRDQDLYEVLRDTWVKANKARDDREREMFLRLAALQPSLYL